MRSRRHNVRIKVWVQNLSSRTRAVRGGFRAGNLWSVWLDFDFSL
jgi:hypothetical protein